jgi:hypothetical protein
VASWEVNCFWTSVFFFFPPQILLIFPHKRWETFGIFFLSVNSTTFLKVGSHLCVSAIVLMIRISFPSDHVHIVHTNFINLTLLTYCL